ncbi:M56 family metallopeptidase [Desulforamulus ruminis]
MEKFFLAILNMSLTASYVILFIMLIRLPLKKAPKVISYALWSVAAFRLLCPFSFESAFSLLPKNTPSISTDVLYQPPLQINRDITGIDPIINGALPVPTAEAVVNPLQLYTQIGAYIWIAGIMVMLVYSILSVFILNKRLKNATLSEPGIYEADNLKTPFVLGVFKPSIYIPAGLTAEEKSYIIRHEQAHISRFDHIVKPFAFLVLSIHWFNPLVWVAFLLMSTDMELSCDEKVIREMGYDIKKAYSASLLSLASGRRILNGNPLAFGEGDVKGRIKNILHYHKPVFWVMAVTVIAVIAVGIGLLSNPRQPVPSDETRQTTLEPTSPEWSPEQTVGADMAKLDYASDDMVIFHGYFGLFVYDLNSLQIIRSLDLKPLNCHQTQGDNYCEVSVSTDGNTVQLHPMSSENMYVYTVSSHTLQETTYRPMEDEFDGRFVPIEDAIGSEKTGNYSYNAVRFDTGDYGFLRTIDWTLGALSYVRGDRKYSLFNSE